MITKEEIGAKLQPSTESTNKQMIHSINSLHVNELKKIIEELEKENIDINYNNVELHRAIIKQISSDSKISWGFIIIRLL